MFLCDFLCPGWMIGFQMAWPSDGRKKHSGLHETVRISDLISRFCRSCRGDRGEEHRLSMLGVAHSPKCGRENILREYLQEFRQELHPTPATVRHCICLRAAKSISRDPKLSQSTGIVVYHWSPLWSPIIAILWPQASQATGGTLKTRSFFLSMGCRVGHRFSAALVSGQSRGVSRWTCVMPVWAHEQ